MATGFKLAFEGSRLTNTADYQDYQPFKEKLLFFLQLLYGSQNFLSLRNTSPNMGRIKFLSSGRLTRDRYTNHKRSHSAKFWLVQNCINARMFTIISSDH